MRGRWCFSAALLLFLTQGGEARAQPCEVVHQGSVQLDDNGSAVYTAINRLTGHPAVSWVGDDERVYLSRFDGSAWSGPEFVDTQGIKPVYDGTDYPHPGLALAIDSCGTHHLLIVDVDNLYHFVEGASGWSAPTVVTSVVPPNPADPHLQIRADFDDNDRLHVVYAIDGGNDASGKGVRYVQLLDGGWSAPLWIGSGPFMHMNVGRAGSVHVTYLHFHGMVGEWRNYQGHYRQRQSDGTWLPEEQATDEPPIGTLGPVAIHPAVAVAPDGRVHLVYPVDPPDPSTAPQEAGHASLITRTATGWTQTPEWLFDNAIHSAFVNVAVDPAGVIYAFGLNWDKRYRVDTGAGFDPVQYWDPAHARWFYHSVAAGPAGAWIGYVAARRMGPIKVALLERTGSCGTFCGDGVCSAAEDGCSCRWDCADQCCIDGTAQADNAVNPADPCEVCQPGVARCEWTQDPGAPGCTPDAGTPPQRDGATGADAAPLDASSNPDPSAHASCSCQAEGAPSSLPVAIVLLALLIFMRRRQRR